MSEQLIIAIVWLCGVGLGGTLGVFFTAAYFIRAAAKELA